MECQGFRGREAGKQGGPSTIRRGAEQGGREKRRTDLPRRMRGGKRRFQWRGHSCRRHFGSTAMLFLYWRRGWKKQRLPGRLAGNFFQLRIGEAQRLGNFYFFLGEQIDELQRVDDAFALK